MSNAALKDLMSTRVPIDVIVLMHNPLACEWAARAVTVLAHTRLIESGASTDIVPSLRLLARVQSLRKRIDRF